MVVHDAQADQLEGPFVKIKMMARADGRRLVKDTTYINPGRMD
jgi:hypothetical protein